MELLETMRLEAGAVALLDLHLARLSRSAAHLGYPVVEEAVRWAIAAAGRALPAAPHRLRLTVDASGRVAVSADPLAGVPPIRTVYLFPAPGGLGGPTGRHKTTARALYAPALARAAAAGADEPLFVDAGGHLIESARANVWVRRRGRLLTPPLDGGGLPGVMRAHLLATRPEAAVAPLAADRIGPGEELLLSNAVRGLWRVRLIGTPGGRGGFEEPLAP